MGSQGSSPAPLLVAEGEGSTDKSYWGTQFARREVHGADLPRVLPNYACHCWAHSICIAAREILQLHIQASSESHGLFVWAISNPFGQALNDVNTLKHMWKTIQLTRGSTG